MYKFTSPPELIPFQDFVDAFSLPPAAVLFTQAVVRPLWSLAFLSPEPLSPVSPAPVATEQLLVTKVSEVEGLMYEKGPAHRRPHGHHPLPHKGRTSLIAGGVRIGSNAEEGRELMVLLKISRLLNTTRRSGRKRGHLELQYADSRAANTSIPSTPVAPCSHISSTTTPMSTMSVHTPHQVYTRRPRIPQFEYPRAWQQPTVVVQPLQPPVPLTSPIQHRRPSSHLRTYPALPPPTQGTSTTNELTPKTR